VSIPRLAAGSIGQRTALERSLARRPAADKTDAAIRTIAEHRAT
jgi:hypothetical protein